MNSFDIAVLLGLAFAVVAGFKTGLIRSAVTILAYLIAMPIAIAAMSMIGPAIARMPSSPLPENWTLLFGVFLLVGALFGRLFRSMLDDTIGSDIAIFDRLAGAALGAVRAGLVAVTVVLIFDQLVPLARQPQFLNGSQLRPLLSAAGQKGFRSLPPDVAMTIERLRREHHI